MRNTATSAPYARGVTAEADRQRLVSGIGRRGAATAPSWCGPTNRSGVDDVRDIAAQDELSIRVGCATGGLVITSRGVVDSLTAPLLAGILQEATSEPRIPIVLDLSRVRSLTEGGAAVIEAARAAMLAAGQALVVSADGTVRGTLIAHGITDVLDDDLQRPDR